MKKTSSYTLPTVMRMYMASKHTPPVALHLLFLYDIIVTIGYRGSV